VGLRPPSCPCGCSCFVLGSGLVPLLFCRLSFVFGGEMQIWLGDLRVVWCLDGCVALDCHSCHSLYSLNSRCVQCSLLFRLYNFRTEPLSFIGRTWEKNGGEAPWAGAVGNPDQSRVRKAPGHPHKLIPIGGVFWTSGKKQEHELNIQGELCAACKFWSPFEPHDYRRQHLNCDTTSNP